MSPTRTARCGCTHRTRRIASRKDGGRSRVVRVRRIRWRNRHLADRLVRLEASHGNLRKRGVKLAPLAGYNEPDQNLARHWGGENPLGYRGAKPERSDLGKAEGLVADVMEATSERRSP